MEQSAVFSNEIIKTDNPFYSEPEPRTFYHPTLPKKLTSKQRGISLSPERVKYSTGTTRGQLEEKGKELSPGEKGFLSGANTMLAKELPTHDTPSPGPGETSSKFDESWPTSERPSTIESPGENQNVSSSSAGTPSHVTGSQSSQSMHDLTIGSLQRAPDNQADSTLGRLIDRFRYGAPRSREERGKVAPPGTKDFWWLTSTSSTTPPSHHQSSSSTTKQPDQRPGPGPKMSIGSMGTSRLAGRTGGGKGRGKESSRIPTASRGLSAGGVMSASGRKGSGVSTLASTSSGSFRLPSSGTDSATAELQRRAEKLLEMSESSTLSEPAISSEGVGESSTSSPSYDDATPTRKELSLSAIHADKENLPRPPLFPANLSYTQHPQRAEDDILLQWRMRRRIEQAKEGAIQRVSHHPLRETRRENVGARKEGTVGENTADSKLAEFRQRLQQQRLLTQARATSDIQPVRETSTSHTGTDPIPQSTATQTNGETASRVCDLNTDGSRLVRGGDLKTGGDGGGKRTDFDKPGGVTVASPNVINRKSRTHSARDYIDDVTPHLHLSCDILPCNKRGPHQHSQSDLSDRVRLSGYDGLDQPDRCSERDRLQGGEERRHSSEYVRERTLDQSDYRHDRERLPISGVAGRAPVATKDNSVQDVDDSARYSREQHQTRSESTSETLQRRTDNMEQRPQDLEEDNDSFAGNTTDPPCHRNGPSYRLRTELDDQVISLHDDAAPVTGGRDASPAARQLHQNSTGGEGVDGARRQIQFESSPINSAIGQVIGKRMFTSSVGQRSLPSGQRSSLPSSPESSILSQDTLMFTPPRDPQASKGAPERLARGADMVPMQGTESQSSSDGEEFKDDAMLAVLRSQRRECIRQLNQLDMLLSQPGTE